MTLSSSLGRSAWHYCWYVSWILTHFLILPCPISFSSVQFSHSVVSDSLRPHGLQHARPPHPSPPPRAYSNSCPSSQWCHPTISPLSSPSPPAFNLSQHQGLFQWVISSHQVTKVLELQLQHQSFQWISKWWACPNIHRFHSGPVSCRCSESSLLKREQRWHQCDRPVPAPCALDSKRLHMDMRLQVDWKQAMATRG